MNEIEWSSLNLDSLEITVPDTYYQDCKEIDEVMFRYYSRNGTIEATAFKVVKHTPKGVKIMVEGTERFVKNDSIKRFAYETKKQALEGFIFRKKRQLKILSARIETTKVELDLAEKMIQELTTK